MLTQLDLFMEASAASLPEQLSALHRLRQLSLRGPFWPAPGQLEAAFAPLVGLPVLHTLCLELHPEQSRKMQQLPRCLEQLPALRTLVARHVAPRQPGSTMPAWMHRLRDLTLCASAAAADSGALAAATQLTRLTLNDTQPRASDMPTERQVLALLECIQRLPALTELVDEGGLGRVAQRSQRCLLAYGMLLRDRPGVRCLFTERRRCPCAVRF